jgi:hypothetical protein
MIEDEPGAVRDRSLRAGELAALLIWPWFLAAAVAVSATGRRGLGEGDAASFVLGAGSVFLALVAAPLAAVRLRALDLPSRAGRAGAIAAAAAALASGPIVACVAASSSVSGTVVCGAFLLGLTGYAALQAAALAGAAYPAVAALWLGAPPFAFYLVLDVLGRRADWLLYLSPTSAAVLTVSGPESAWSRALGRAAGGAGLRLGTVWPLLVIGAALSVLSPYGGGSERASPDLAT